MSEIKIKTLYQIYTEDLHRNVIENIVGREFTGFSILEATGYWLKQKEKAIVIEIIGAYDYLNLEGSREELGKVRFIANLIKNYNGQDSVILTYHNVRYEEV